MAPGGHDLIEAGAEPAGGGGREATFVQCQAQEESALVPVAKAWRMRSAASSVLMRSMCKAGMTSAAARPKLLPPHRGASQGA